MLRSLFATVLTATSLTAVPSAEPAAPAADADFIERWAATNKFSLGTPRHLQPTPDGKTVLFLRSGPRSFVHDLHEFDPRTGEERTLLSAAELLAGGEEVLTPDEKARRERLRLAARGIADYSVSEDGRRILVPLSGRLFVVERDSRRVRELAGIPVPEYSRQDVPSRILRDGRAE